MPDTVDRRRVLIFLAFAFGIAWAGALVIALTGGLVNSPELVAGSRVTLALVLLSTVYMWAPALAHIFTRLLTREPWRGLHLWPRLAHGWPFWILAWVLPGILTILGAAVYYAIFPGDFDPGLGPLRALLESNPATRGLNIDPWTVAIAQTLQAVLIAPLVNGLSTFGEEFGWRAYLLPRLLPLGGRRAVLLLGVIWGMWHWPVIAMGYEYGFGYWGFPWLGFLVFLAFTTALSVLLGWAALRAASVWPAVIGHGAINGIAALALLALRGPVNLMLGPTPIGLIALLPWLLVVVPVLLSRRALAPPAPPPADDAA